MVLKIDFAAGICVDSEYDSDRPTLFQRVSLLMISENIFTKETPAFSLLYFLDPVLEQRTRKIVKV